MINNNLRIALKLRFIFMFMMILVSGESLSEAGKLIIENGDQNKDTFFTFSPHAGQYDCFYNSGNVLGEKHSVGSGESFSFIVTNSCSGKPAKFSIYTEDEKRIAFAMHGNSGFVYIPIDAAAGGYSCSTTDNKCLQYNAYDSTYTFKTNYVKPTPVAKAGLKLGRMKGRWKEVCPPGISCALTMITSVTDGESDTDIRSKEVSNAVANAFTLGIDTDLKFAGNGTKLKVENTTTFEHAVAKSTAREIGTTSATTKGQQQKINVDYDTKDVNSVWRWVLAAKRLDKSGKSVEIATNIFGCSPTGFSPNFLPNSPEHIKACHIKRKK